MDFEPLSKDFLRKRMEISRDARIQRNIDKILDGIKHSASLEQTEHIINIFPKQYPHVMFGSTIIDEDIADEVLKQLQPLLGDIEIQKIDNRIICRW